MATQVPAVPVYGGDFCAFPSYTFQTSGTPINLTGWVWTCYWRRVPGSDAFIALTVDSSQATTGVINISATEAQTLLMGTSGVWDLHGVNSGTDTTWLSGTTTYTEPITNV